MRLLAPVLLVLTLTGATTACSGGSSGSPAHSSAAPAGPTSTAALSTDTPALPATAPNSPTALAAFLQRGFAAFGSARIAFSTALSGNALAGGGDVRLGAGQVTGLDVTATVSKIGRVHYVLAGAGGYAALPKPVAGKPYVLLGGSHSSDELTRAAIGLQATKLLASPATYRTLVLAAPSLQLVDRLGVAGVPALHYRGPVPVDRIPSSDAVRIALGALGVDRLDLDLWVDGAGRPVKASAPADGRASDVSFSAVNRPVTVAAPPADQVAS